MAVFLLRHTQTATPESVCYGSLDVALASTYLKEWAAISPPPVDTIYSSPLTRCHQLAHHIASSQGLTVKLDNRLAEMNFGQWQGLKWVDIPRTQIDAWAEDFENYQGHGGESVAELRRRVQEFLKGLDPNRNHLLVSHAGVIRTAQALHTNTDERQIKVAYGELIQLH